MRTRLMTVALAFCAPAAHAAWELELGSGNALSLRSPLELRQGDYHEKFSAHYATRPLKTPAYYLVRIARMDAPWELSLIHHKLHLQNRSAAVGQFDVTHGFNLVTLDRVARREHYFYRIGAGPVITYIEAQVNGVSYDGPWAARGIGAVAGIGRHTRISRHWRLSTELLASAGYAQPTARGDIPLETKITNIAVHAQIGLRFRY